MKQNEQLLVHKAIEILKTAKSIFVLTGAGISAESGIPTFRGADGLWKNYSAADLATPEAFAKNPALVWEWYHWRQSLIIKAKPNPAHYALVEIEKRFDKFLLLTQNVDDLHRRAGSKNLLELHGNIFRARCLNCGKVIEHHRSMDRLDGHCEERSCLEQHRESDEAISRRRKKNDEIATPLDGLGARNDNGVSQTIQKDQANKLPTCGCGGLLRPDIVWFGEMIPQDIWQESLAFLSKADVAIICGTSGVVWPAAAIPEIAKKSGAKTIGINLEPTPITDIGDVSLLGKAGELLPQLVRGLSTT